MVEIITKPFSIGPRLKLMAARRGTTRTTTSVCVFARSGATGVGIIASYSQHLLFAEARTVNPKILLDATRIVHEYMWYLTDEALRLALLIAGDEAKENDPPLGKAQHYLNTGITPELARKLLKESNFPKELANIATCLEDCGFASSDKDLSITLSIQPVLIAPPPHLARQSEQVALAA